MKLRAGLVGCGNIAGIYLHNAPAFRDIAVVACADLREDSARDLADRFSIRALPVTELIDGDAVDIVVNLTTPDVHADVSLAAIAAGRHVYSEKPLATDLASGEAVAAAARKKGVRLGVAPDTVLGPAIQTARRLLDEGAIGRPLTAVATVMYHGADDWHPNPAFFYRPGAGPILDMGPYYLHALITLLGPVASVWARSQTPFTQRPTLAESPSQGRPIAVETPTSYQVSIRFVGGAEAIFIASWDVFTHSLPPIELYGSDGTLTLPDPNWFGGDVRLAPARRPWQAVDTAALPFGRANWPLESPRDANYRGLGLADMARAIIDGRPHRASGELALHALDVMIAIIASAESGAAVDIASSCERPPPLGPEEAAALLAHPAATS